jgi:hypothetical protein
MSYFKLATVQKKEMSVISFFKTMYIKMQSHYITQYGKDPTSNNAIQYWLQQFQESDSVLCQKGVGRTNTLQEYANLFQ